MKALILAAGYATRLYPLTKEYPKPLLVVKNRPIIDYILEKLDEVPQIDEIIVVTNSKFIGLFRNWASRLKIKKRLTLIDDLTRTHKARRGAVGDIDFVLRKKRIEDDLIVIGGDNLFADRLDEFLEFTKSKKEYPVIGVYDIKQRRQVKKYGILTLDRQKRIVDFREKPRSSQSTLVAMCLYYFPQKKLFLIRQYLENKENRQDATGFYIDWLKEKMPVYGFIFKGRWYDIGDRKFYHEAKKWKEEEYGST
jgi:glucose-1-phosphate thymidylyltransferase